MTIGIIGSMAFTDQMLALKTQLNNAGHTALVSDFCYEYTGKSAEEIARQTIKDKNERNGLLEMCEKIAGVDAVLALNLEKRGIANYIGGNTLIKLGYAFILGKKIFLWNPVPKIDLYQSEIEAMKPVVLDKNLSLLLG